MLFSFSEWGRENLTFEDGFAASSLALKGNGFFSIEDGVDDFDLRDDTDIVERILANNYIKTSKYCALLCFCFHLTLRLELFVQQINQ